MTPKLIITDLDGTLVDTKEVNFHAYSEALAKFGYGIDYQYFCRFCNGRHYLDFIPGIVPDKSIYPDIHRLKINAYPKYISYAVLNTFLYDMLKIFSSQRVKTAIVTTASRTNTAQMLRHYNLSDLFDIIITREDVTNCKPDPEGFIKAMSICEAKPTETIIFEDSDIGVEAAKKCGAYLYRTYGYS